MRRNTLFGVVVTLAFSSAGPAFAQSDASELWTGLQRDVFGGRPVVDGNAPLSLRAPSRAEDAAIVPMTITVEQPAVGIRAITLIVDANPSPVAASFAIGPRSGLTSISTRVRVNESTLVHAVAESADGALHAVGRRVIAAGGCSAPSAKSLDEALAHLGTIKVRDIPAADLANADRREAQIMIRHPNNSGMQMDQATQLYIPARYIDQLSVRQGDDLLFRMEGGISLSEDPNFRFTYVPNGAKTLTIDARDSDGATFHADYPIAGAS